MPVEYQREGDVLFWDQGPVRFRAAHIRREGQRIHATVTIAEQGRILEEDDIQPGRREDRIRLANAAHANLNGVAGYYPKDQMAHDLLLFTRDLWAAYVGNAVGERLAGASEQKAPPWLLVPFLLEGAGTILFAPPGRGKSWTGMMWAVSVDAGLQFPWPTKQGPVLYINLERSADSMSARLASVNVALGLERERGLLFMNRRGARLSDLLEPAIRTVEREGVVLVVLDSLSRAGYGDLNANDSANSGMDALNATGVAWLTLAHTPAADEDKIFGSQMFEAAADLTVQLKTQERENVLGIGLTVRKANDVRKPRPQQWAYEFDDFGVSAVREADAFEFETTQPAESLKDRIIAHLFEQGADDATHIGEATGVARTTVADLLRNDSRSFRFIRKDGRRALYHLSSDVTLRHIPSVTSSRAHGGIQSHVTTEFFSKESVTSSHGDEEGPF